VKTACNQARKSANIKLGKRRHKRRKTLQGINKQSQNTNDFEQEKLKLHYLSLRRDLEKLEQEISK